MAALKPGFKSVDTLPIKFDGLPLVYELGLVSHFSQQNMAEGMVCAIQGWVMKGNTAQRPRRSLGTLTLGIQLPCWIPGHVEKPCVGVPANSMAEVPAHNWHPSPGL